MVRDGAIYVGTVDGKFHAVQAKDGAEIWTWEGAAPIYGDALVTGDAVFVVNDRTELVRLDRKTGALRWRVALDPARSAPAALPDDDIFNHRTAVPVLAAGKLFVGSTDGGMLAIDPARGQTLWRVEAGSKICAPAAVAAEVVVIGTVDGSLLALRRADGGLAWRRKLDAGIVSAPVVHHGMAIVGARDFQLHGVDLATGREVWTRHFWASWVESTPRIAQDVMYVGSSDLRAVRAMDPATGELRWSTDVLGAAWGSPVVAGATVYMGAAAVQGYMIAHAPSLVALDRRTGAIRWRQTGPTGGTAAVTGYAGSLAYANHTLFAAGLDGSLAALPVP